VNRWPALSAALGHVLAITACSSGILAVAEDGAGPDGGRGDAAGSPVEGSTPLTGCVGSAPDCFGSDLQGCCGQDPSGVATCNGSEWTCGGVGAPGGNVGAPGCNGASCTQPAEGGKPDASSSCIGTAPNCFGSDSQACCGAQRPNVATCACDPTDPAGSACTVRHWMCGTAAAPGCDGTPCASLTDSGSGDSAGGCSGPTPSCFGNDLQTCCGNEPSGIAMCVGSAWLCGTVAAPGCDGTTCP
jgi:hypothetical protein